MLISVNSPFHLNSVMSISVSNVTKIYGDQKALNNVSFNVEPGEIIGFLGPNGAGKSTMMKIISGYIPQTEGVVKVCGLDVIGSEIEIKNKIGYLPENNPLYHEMYIKEYLEFAAGLFHLNNIKQKVSDSIELVGLIKEQNKKIGQLSKGYKQRVGLAQAFIHNPEVMILDEPTTGLDPNQIVEIRQLIKEIGKDKTVMLSTHIMQEVEAICDRAIIIHEGVIVANQDIKSLKSSGTSNEKFSVEFSKIMPISLLEKHLNGILHSQISDTLFEFTGKDLSSVKKSIMQFSIDADVEIVQMNEIKSNLEDVFRQLTGKGQEAEN